MRGYSRQLYPREDRNAPAKLAIRCSLQLGVFRLGFLEDRDVGVGVFPESKEILIRSLGLGFVSRQSERSLVSCPKFLEQFEGSKMFQKLRSGAEAHLVLQCLRHD